MSQADAENLSNVSFVTSWNGDNSGVSVLLFYGVKLSNLELFQSDRRGHFEEVAFSPPDPNRLFHADKSERLDLDAFTGFSANGLGPWRDGRTATFVAGEAKELTGRVNYFFATFNVTVADRRASVKGVRPVGKLTEQQANAFIDKWGRRYFEHKD